MARREPISSSRRRDIFERTRGKCHICHKQLSFSNYGRYGDRGAWHVDHSVAIARGGTNHGNNLKAACIPCNLDKSTAIARTARAWNGRRRAPLSAARYEATKSRNALAGAATGAGVGALLGGPALALLFGMLGWAIGDDVDPDSWD